MASKDLTLSDFEGSNSRSPRFQGKVKVTHTSKTLQRSQVRSYVTINHQYETIYGQSSDTLIFDLE